MKSQNTLFSKQGIKKYLIGNSLLFYLLIIFITVISLLPLFSLYFSYEDFQLFYIFQHPAEINEFLNLSETKRHYNLYYLIYPFYRLFGYNTIGYYFVIIVLASIVSCLFFNFLLLLTRNKTVSFFAAVLYATSYYGIESFTWNTTHCIEITCAFIFILISLICYVKFLQSQKKILYFYSLVLFALLLYFFQAKSFHLIFIFVLLTLLYGQFSFFRKIANITPYGITTIILFFSTLRSGVNNYHILLNFNEIIHHFFATIANQFIPLTVIEWVYKSLNFYTTLELFDSILLFNVIIGVLVCVVLILTAFFLRKQLLLFKLFWLSLFVFIIYIAFAFFATIIGSGLPITTLQSIHHTMSPAVFWSTILSALFFTIILQRFSRLIYITHGIFTIVLIMLIFFSWQEIDKISSGRNGQLRYFYETLIRQVPNVSQPSVFYFSFATPRPLSPFASGNINIKTETYLAGFYNTNYRNILLAKTYDEAIMLLKKNNIPPERFYYFYYRKYDLINLSNKIKTFAKEKEPISINITNLQNTKPLQVASYGPLLLQFNVQYSINYDAILISQQKENLIPYYNLLLKRKEETSDYKISADPPESADEFTKASNVNDGDYATVWLPKQWTNNGVTLTLDMKKVKKINAIAWSGARKSPWKQRSPAEYIISVSTNGSDWKEIAQGKKEIFMKEGEFFFHRIKPTMGRYVKLTITKTLLNFQPTVDELEVFGEEFENLNYATFYAIKSEPLQNIPDQTTLNNVLQTVYKDNIYITVNFKRDSQKVLFSEKQHKIFLEPNKYSYTIPIPPDGLEIQQIIFAQGNIPLHLDVTNVSVIRREYLYNIEEVK